MERFLVTLQNLSNLTLGFIERDQSNAGNIDLINETANQFNWSLSNTNPDGNVPGSLAEKQLCFEAGTYTPLAGGSPESSAGTFYFNDSLIPESMINDFDETLCDGIYYDKGAVMAMELFLGTVGCLLLLFLACSCREKLSCFTSCSFWQKEQSNGETKNERLIQNSAV